MKACARSAASLERQLGEPQFLARLRQGRRSLIGAADALHDCLRALETLLGHIRIGLVGGTQVSIELRLQIAHIEACQQIAAMNGLTFTHEHRARGLR